MGLEDEVYTKTSFEFTYDELRITFYDLLAEYKKVDLKYNALR